MSDPLPTAPAPRGYLNWWQGLILAASSALIGVVVAIYIKQGAGIEGAAPSWAMMILRFVPHFLMLFGVLADAFTYEGVYWTGTAVGILSMFVGPYIGGAFTQLGKIPGYVMQKGGRQRGGDDSYAGSTLTGMAGKEGTPETLVITAAILSYYIFDLMFGISVLDAVGAIVAGIILFGGQAMSISGSMGDSPGLSAALAGLAGSIVGGSSYAAVSTWAPQYLPSTVLVGSTTSGGGMPRGGGSGPGRQGVGMSGNAPLASGSGVPGSATTCAR
jgi:hypothetical protein